MRLCQSKSVDATPALQLYQHQNTQLKPMQSHKLSPSYMVVQTHFQFIKPVQVCNQYVMANSGCQLF